MITVKFQYLGSNNVQKRHTEIARNFTVPKPSRGQWILFILFLLSSDGHYGKYAPNSFAPTVKWTFQNCSCLHTHTHTHTCTHSALVTPAHVHRAIAHGHRAVCTFFRVNTAIFRNSPPSPCSVWMLYVDGWMEFHVFIFNNTKLKKKTRVCGAQNWV